MDLSHILYPEHNIPVGQLYHNRKLDKIEASVPTCFNTNHAAYLFETRNGDLLYTWFGDGYCGEANRTANRRYEYPC